MSEKFLSHVYDVTTQEETDALYTAWAPTYDQELTEHGYRSPRRCAEALAQFVPRDQPILDMGCGTGLSGRALADVGFEIIDGQDVNEEMVAIARHVGVYRKLRVVDPAEPYPFAPGTYPAIAAIGVIGVGAAPPSLLGQTLDALEPGGHLVFSFNDHVIDDSEYADALDDALASGKADEVFCEYGVHIEKLGSGSNVHVLERR